MSEILEITPENFAATVEQDRTVIIDAWAAWCGPCRGFAPVFEKAARENPDHIFAKLDTEAHQDLVKSLQIANIPTLMIYRDGILLYHKAGSPDSEILADLVSQVETLDMDMVRADIADEEVKTAEAEAAADGEPA